MKKEETKRESSNNDLGIVAVVFGILSIVFSTVPLNGIILSILGIVFSKKQERHSKNKWSKNAKVLSIIGLLLSILFWMLFTWILKTLGPSGIPA